MPSPDKQFQPATQALREAGPLAYGRMKQRHGDYDGRRMQELHDLFSGGYETAAKASSYLKLVANEHSSRFEDRCRTTAYIGYFGQVVTDLTSDLFAQALSVMAPADDDNPKTPGEPPDEFYKQFETDCDLRGTPLVDLLRELVNTALVQRDAFLCLDAPAPDPSLPAPASKAEEEERGARRFYAYERSPREVIDWKEDDRGGFAWLIVNYVRQDRESPEDLRDKVVETFVVWRMTEGVAEWKEFEISYEADKPPKEKDLVRETGRGGKTSFRRIPVLRLRVAKGFWIGNIVGWAQKEHWERRSRLNGAKARSLTAVPVLKMGSEIGEKGGALPAEVQQDPNRGSELDGSWTRDGVVRIGADDDFGYAETEGKNIAVEEKSVDELKDEIFRVTHLMAASVRPSAGSLGRSAASKQQDGKMTALVLRALGEIVRKFVLLVYKTISDARGDGEVHWVANGLDNYEVIDREQVIEEAISMAMVDIPSETFAITYAMQIAEKLLTGVDPQTLDTMRKEIEKGIRERFATKSLEKDAKETALQDQIDNPPSELAAQKAAAMPKVPGAKVPAAKAPAPKAKAPGPPKIGPKG